MHQERETWSLPKKILTPSGGSGTHPGWESIQINIVRVKYLRGVPESYMGQRNKIMDLVDTWPPNSMDLTLIPEGREPQEGDER